MLHCVFQEQRIWVFFTTPYKFVFWGTLGKFLHSEERDEHFVLSLFLDEHAEEQGYVNDFY